MCRRSIGTLLVVSLVCLLSVANPLAANMSKATLIPRSNSDQIYIIVHLLAEVLNPSNQYDSASLSQIFRNQEEFHTLLGIKEEFQQLESTQTPQVWLTIRNLIEYGASISAECDAIFQVDNMISSMTINLIFDKDAIEPRFSNSGAFEDSLSKFLAGHRLLIDKNPRKKERPTQSRDV